MNLITRRRCLRLLALIGLAAVSVAAQDLGTALVRHAPAINGTIEGSVQQLGAEDVVLNGGAVLTQDLLVPGTPAIRQNGKPNYGGTLEGPGAVTPSNYQVILNGNAAVRHIVRRTDPRNLPSVAAVAAPTGTRNLTITASAQPVGEFGALRDLTLTGNAGNVAVPPGNYGSFTANGGCSFTLGVAGAREPAVYSFQQLTLNGRAELRVVGPVIVTVANSLIVNGVAGAAGNPTWLALRLPTANLTVNGGAILYAAVTAPAGGVTLNGNSQLIGSVASDRLTVNSNALLRLVAPAANNQRPAILINAPQDGASFLAPATVALAVSATDPDGTVAKVEFFQGTTKLGEDASAPFELAIAALTSGSYTFFARAIDNLGASSDAAPVSITVTNPNQPPTVAITSPTGGTLYTAPAVVSLAAAATDPDGTIVKVEFYQGTSKLGEDLAAPFEFAVPPLAAGTYGFSAKAFDQLGASTVSDTVTVTVVNPNQPPVVALIAPANGTTYTAPAEFTLSVTAGDSDGMIARVEFFRDAVRIGEDQAAPYELGVVGLTAGKYNFVARAYDNAGSATDSTAIGIVVNAPNVPPSITLIAPATGATLGGYTPLTLSATATDADGSIATVEFFEGPTRLGSGVAATPGNYTCVLGAGLAPGVHLISAKATDNAGAATESAVVTVTVIARLPYTADFEATEGYLLGSLAAQLGWQVGAGAATIVADAAYSGGRSVLLSPGTSLAQVAQSFVPLAGEPIVFVEFFGRPVADENLVAATTFDLDSARLAFRRNGASGELQVFFGDGAGSGTWQPTGFVAPLNGDGASVQWIRVTVRLDFANKRWDAYANGALVATDVGFRDNSRTALTSFGVRGHATTASRFDYVFAAPTNPLFADADRDGMDDAWELQNGLNPLANDRSGDLDGDGLSNLREFQLGTRANAVDTDGDGIPDNWEVAYGLNPRFSDATADPDGDGVSNLQEYLLGRNPTKPATADLTGAVNLRLYLPTR